MTSTISQSPSTPKPSKPWEPTVRERSQKVLNFFISLALSIILLFTTGLNGKLGWFIAFFASWTAVAFIAEYRRAGKPAAQDSLLTSVSRFAITLAIIPIISILTTVAVKGWRGMHWGLFTQDMAQATVNDYTAKYVSGNSPYDTPYYYELPELGKWIVKNKSTGKALKNIKYKKVDFSSIL